MHAGDRHVYAKVGCAGGFECLGMGVSREVGASETPGATSTNRGGGPAQGAQSGGGVGCWCGGRHGCGHGVVEGGGRTPKSFSTASHRGRLPPHCTRFGGAGTRRAQARRPGTADCYMGGAGHQVGKLSRQGQQQVSKNPPRKAHWCMGVLLPPALTRTLPQIWRSASVRSGYGRRQGTHPTHPQGATRQGATRGNKSPCVGGVFSKERTSHQIEAPSETHGLI